MSKDGEIQGDIEIWARLGEAALKIKSFGPAIECCKQAVQLSGSLDQRDLSKTGIGVALQSAPMETASSVSFDRHTKNHRRML